MRSKLAVGLGAFYVVMGLTIAISPEWFLSLVDWGSREGQLASAGIRLVAGSILLLAAASSRFPKTFAVIGTIALVAGALIPFVSVEFWSE